MLFENMQETQIHCMLWFGKFHSTYPLISFMEVFYEYFTRYCRGNEITYVICIVFIDICLIHYGIKFGFGMITICLYYQKKKFADNFPV